jgi:hypothetical protein
MRPFSLLSAAKKTVFSTGLTAMNGYPKVDDPFATLHFTEPSAAAYAVTEYLSSLLNAETNTVSPSELVAIVAGWLYAAP